MIGVTRAGVVVAIWTLCITAILMIPAIARAQRGAPQNIVVDITPSHAVSSFSPFRSLGASVDRLRGGVASKVMTPEFIQKIQSAELQTVSYRQNTELFAEAWPAFVVGRPHAIGPSAATYDGRCTAVRGLFLRLTTRLLAFNTAAIALTAGLCWVLSCLQSFTRSLPGPHRQPWRTRPSKCRDGNGHCDGAAVD